MKRCFKFRSTSEILQGFALQNEVVDGGKRVKPGNRKEVLGNALQEVIDLAHLSHVGIRAGAETKDVRNGHGRRLRT